MEQAHDFLRAKNLSSLNIIATHFRTEKWGSATEGFGAACVSPLHVCQVLSCTSTDLLQAYFPSLPRRHLDLY